MTQAPFPITCPRCTAALPDDAVFCRRCGIGLTRPALPQRAVFDRTTTVTYSKPALRSKKSSCGLWPLIILAIVSSRAFTVFQHSSSTPQLRFAPPPIQNFRPPAPRIYTPIPPVPQMPAPPWHPNVQPLPHRSVDDVHWGTRGAWPDSQSYFDPASRSRDYWRPAEPGTR